MDILETVIFNLTSDEVRRFKILSNRFKAEDEKKLIILFDAIRSLKFENDESGLVKSLYGDTSPQTRNRYYRLRNKLLDNLEKSLVFYHFKYKVSIHAYYDIQLSLLFRERGNYDLSLYFLRKAEKTATENDQFNILEVIYEEYVQLALKDITINLDRVLELRRENDEKLKLHRKNSEMLAVIIQQLKRSNFGRGNRTISEFLDRTRKRLEKSNEIFQSVEGRILVFRAVSAMLQQKRAWDQLVEFVENTLLEFEDNNWFTNNNHNVRLMMRLWLVNALMKCLRFRDAARQIEIFEKEMEMYNGQNHSTYLFAYYNIKINHAKYSGNTSEAYSLIRKALSAPELRAQPSQESHLLGSLADHYFNAAEYEKAAGVLKEIVALPEENQPAESIRLAIAIFEEVCAFEQGKYDQVTKIYNALRKKFKGLLKEKEFQPADVFAELVDRMAQAERAGKRVSLRSAHKKFMDDFGASEPGENSIIFYDLWLQSKAEEISYSSLLARRMK